MSFERVDPKADFPGQEREILRFWDETKAFERLRELNRGKPRWSFLDGPITANNPMGVHHAWGRAYKDIYQRYHAAAPSDAPSRWGHELRYQNGFDCQGLWVEVEVEKEHGFTTKRDIETFGVDRFVEECKARAQRFAAIQTEQSKRLGYWMDWDNSYYTMSDENNYAIWAFLKKCFEKGLVYKGMDVMPWCPRCGTGISQMEMNEGYREVPHTSVFIKLPIRGRKNENLLVWTTTPWTLSSNVAAAVRPGMTYLKIRQGDAYYYLGKGNFENARTHPVQRLDVSKVPGLMSLPALLKNNGPFEIVEEIDGETLVGLTYDGPFDMLDGAAEARDAHRVIAWDLVTESEGTGIVHIAPGCGSEDYHLGKEMGLPQIAPLFEDGRFRPEFGFLAGKRYDEVADPIVADLKQRGVLLAKEQYHHRYPHCWRCRSELVYRLVDEWFINMKWRDEIMESTRQARWIPEWGMDRELDWLRNMGDWMISKKRYWGLALPIWECHDCGHFEVIGGREELKARAAGGWDRFDGHSPHRPWIDAVKLRCAQCGRENVERIKDVGNPWLDASIVPFSTMGYFSDRPYWEQWFPADFIVECLVGQFRNWFYALLAVSTMMEGRSPFKVLKGHGLVTDDEGKPMHKSEGNAIWFDEAAEELGVDVMRWLYAATPPERNVLFGPKHCDEARREVILPWWNVYAFFANLARVDAFDPNIHKAGLESACDQPSSRTAPVRKRSGATEEPPPDGHGSVPNDPSHTRPDAITILDEWILLELDHVVNVANDAYSKFEVVRLCTEAARFINVLSTWYVRRSRRRFYGEGWPPDKLAAYQTLYAVLVRLNRVIAPIVPFLSEAIYQNLVARQCPDEPQSVHHTPFPTAAAGINPLREVVSACLRIVSLARSARKESNLKIRQPLAEMIVVPCDDFEKQAVQDPQLQGHILEELNVKSVALRDSADGLVSYRLEPVKKSIGPKFGRNADAACKAIEKLNGKEVDEKLQRGESVTIDIDGNATPIDAADILVVRSYGDGWAGASDGGTFVLLDTRITPELKNEGLARDIVRNVQKLRKEVGLDIADRIRLRLDSQAEALRGAVDQCGAYIREETLAVALDSDPLTDPVARQEVKIDGEALQIEFIKA